jgi:hypothetical protein
VGFAGIGISADLDVRTWDPAAYRRKVGLHFWKAPSGADWIMSFKPSGTRRPGGHRDDQVWVQGSGRHCGWHRERPGRGDAQSGRFSFCRRGTGRGEARGEGSA